MCSWVTVDAMATALIEMRNAPYPILNLVHPRPVTWTSLMTPISQLLHLPLVSYKDWLSRLRDSATQAPNSSADVKPEEELLKVNPALLILPFFESAGDDGGTNGPEGEAMGQKTLDVKKAVRVAPSLEEGKLQKLGA